jgi:hypothetical protein
VDNARKLGGFSYQRINVQKKKKKTLQNRDRTADGMWELNPFVILTLIYPQE